MVLTFQSPQNAGNNVSCPPVLLDNDAGSPHIDQ
jgi:hypothetical protein